MPYSHWHVPYTPMYYVYVPGPNACIMYVFCRVAFAMKNWNRSQLEKLKCRLLWTFILFYCLTYTLFLNCTCNIQVHYMNFFTLGLDISFLWFNSSTFIACHVIAAFFLWMFVFELDLPWLSGSNSPEEKLWKFYFPSSGCCSKRISKKRMKHTIAWYTIVDEEGRNNSTGIQGIHT